jgi:hypothetical protein
VLGGDARILGLEEAQKELALMDAGVRKQLRKDAKVIVRPLVQEAKATYPRTAKDRSPMRGTNRAWQAVGGDSFPYNQPRARRGVRFTCDISRKGRTVFRVRQVDAAAAVLETVQASGLGTVVRSYFGRRDRFMWKAAKKTQGQVRRELEQAINSFVRGTNAKNRRDASGQVRM